MIRTVVTDLPGDNAIDLSGAWLIHPDTDDQGFAERWWIEGTRFSRGQTATLPCAWQTVLGPDFHGVAWLRRSFQVPAAWGVPSARHCYWLRFESVATDCRAWVNGEEVGRHVGDYVPFQFEIPSRLLHSGALDLVLRIDEMAAIPPAREGDLQNGHITKGFHDVISCQHGGVWQPVRIVRTGQLWTVPDGIAVCAEARTGRVRVTCEFEPRVADLAGNLRVRVRDASGQVTAERTCLVPKAEESIELEMTIDGPELWRPDRPTLYAAEIELSDGHGEVSIEHVSFGFRAVEARGSQILLNGSPVLVRGVLYWGHEPDHIAPAPEPQQVRTEFAQLRRMGFNCVCLCMWYPPRWFFDIADETGMLIWQEHPVWQSPMCADHLAEYQRLYQAFLRRDRNHPSVIIVSATCEHPSFDPDLAAWWWTTARRELPHTLLELQTAFFRWADAERTDLHDEHTYDNSNRWVSYLEDVQHHLRSLPTKPFVMGETVLFTSWPDLPELKQHIGETRPWWLPRSFNSLCDLENAWTGRYGPEVVERFRRQGDRFHLLGRKFQVEQFRRYAGHAGLVMNHLRDVPQCQCGLRDDLGRWRFDPAACAGWLGDIAILLITPDQRRGFPTSADDRLLTCELVLSNFGSHVHRAPVRVRIESQDQPASTIDVELRPCPPGELRTAPIVIERPAVMHPTPVDVTATTAGAGANNWRLWMFPNATNASADGVFRLGGLPFTEAEAAPDDVERAYSRGYGLPVRNWNCAMPDPAVLSPGLPPCDRSKPISSSARVILSHRLTDALVDYLESGGRVVLLASKAAGGLGTRYEWLFGQVPLIIEEGPIRPGASEWIVDLLSYDLTRRYCRVISLEDLGIADQVSPLIRLVYTHDQQRARRFDQLFMSRVGDGLLIVSGLDHSEDAGGYLLQEVLRFAVRDDMPAATSLDPDLLRTWTIERFAGSGSSTGRD